MRIDCHVHTNYSPDSLLGLTELLRLAPRRQLDCLAITDHNTIRGAKALARMDLPFRLICGEEIQTRQGELIGLFLEEEVPAGLEVTKTLELIKAQGGLVLLPHPGDRLRHHTLERSLWEEFLPQVDLVEGYNGRTIFPADDQIAVALGQHFGKPLTAGSDAHTRWELGVCGIETAAFKTPAEFLTVIAQGRCFGGRSRPWIHLLTKGVKYANHLGLRKPERTQNNG